MFDLRAEGIIRDALAGVIRAHDTTALYSTPGVPGEWRLSFKQTKPSEVRNAIHTIFGKVPYCKHLCVYDDDIDITGDRLCGWAMGTRSMRSAKTAGWGATALANTIWNLIRKAKPGSPASWTTTTMIRLKNLVQ